MSSDYWRSPTGIKRLVELFAGDYVFSMFDTIIKLYGEVNKVARYIWIGGMVLKHCPECILGIGTSYSLDEPLPNFPLHNGCQCTLELRFD